MVAIGRDVHYLEIGNGTFKDVRYVNHCYITYLIIAPLKSVMLPWSMR